MFKIFFSSFCVITFLLYGCSIDNNYNIFKPLAERVATETLEVINTNAVNALGNGDYETAKVLYNQALNKDPANMNAILGYSAAVIRIPELVGNIVEACQEFKNSDTIDVNKYKDFAVDRIHEMNQDLNILLDRPGVGEAILKEIDPQVNMNNTITLTVAALVTVADNDTIKTALGIIGDDVDLSEINDKSLSDSLKTNPEVREVISLADKRLEAAQICATKAIGGLITPELVGKIQDAREKLSKFLT
jgi:tetratricopeptide (TPR) repeat protein